MWTDNSVSFEEHSPRVLEPGLVSESIPKGRQRGEMLVLELVTEDWREVFFRNLNFESSLCSCDVNFMKIQNSCYCLLDVYQQFKF